MAIRKLIYTLIIAFLFSCSNNRNTLDIDKTQIENEENKIINIVFDTLLGPDTLWEHMTLIPCFSNSTEERKSIQKKNIEEKRKYKEFRDTATLVVFFDDSLVKFPYTRKELEYKFSNIDSIYHPLIFKLIDSSKSRKFDISLINTKYKYKLDYIKNKEKYHNEIERLGDIYFSRVAFNKDRTKACVYSSLVLGRLNGSGTLFFLEKNKNKWKIIAERRLWVS